MCNVHVVFSTKNREKTITEGIRERLWAYMSGIAKQKGITLRAIGGTDDHMHVLITIQPMMPVAKAVQYLKGISSHWIHETFPEQGQFAWQEGYGAFGIGVSGVEETISYIKSQAEHHRKRTFQDEFIAFLTRHGIEYDPRYIWS
jgi:REP element-mobilizing transposase RayT